MSASDITIISVESLNSLKLIFLSFGAILSLKTEVKLPDSSTAIGIFFFVKCNRW